MNADEEYKRFALDKCETALSEMLASISQYCRSRAAKFEADKSKIILNSEESIENHGVLSGATAAYIEIARRLDTTDAELADYFRNEKQRRPDDDDRDEN